MSAGTSWFPASTGRPSNVHRAVLLTVVVELFIPVVIFIMTFVSGIYVLIFIFTGGKPFVSCSADFGQTELRHLSRYMSPSECLKLLEQTYSNTANSSDNGSHRFPQDSANVERITSKDCLIRLEEWNDNFPGEKSPDARTQLEKVLRSFGRPDLAKYLNRNRRLVELLSGHVSSRSNEHSVSKRHAPGETKNGNMRKKKKKVHQVEPNSVIQKAVAAEKKYEKIEKLEKDCQMVTALTTVGVIIAVLCGAMFFLQYRKKFKKPLGLRFRNRENREYDKQTCAENCGYPDMTGQRVCTCTDLDVESGWSTNTNRCCKVRKNDSETKKSPTVIEIASICTGKPKKKKKKKKLLRSCREKKLKDKERDKEKKSKEKRFREALQQTDLRKFQERIVSILRRDCPACQCCKCTFVDEGCVKSFKRKRMCRDPRCKIQVAREIANIPCPLRKEPRRESKKTKVRKEVCTKKNCPRRNT